MRFRGFSERYLFWQNEEKKKSVSAHIGGGTSQPVRDLACPACPLGGGALRSTVKPEKSQIEHFFFFLDLGKRGRGRRPEAHMELAHLGRGVELRKCGAEGFHHTTLTDRRTRSQFSRARRALYTRWCCLSPAHKEHFRAENSALACRSWMRAAGEKEWDEAGTVCAFLVERMASVPGRVRRGRETS